MTPDHPSIESELNRLRPSSLDSGLLDRLEACTDGSLISLTPTELQLEASLRGFTPVSLPPDLMADLEQIVAGIPYHQDEKVVFFPKAGAPREKTSRFPRPMWAAAAAVALIGASSAFFLPVTGKSPSSIARTSPSSSGSPIMVGGNHIVAADYSRPPSEAHDGGVIWNANDQPRRVLRMVYQDRIPVRNAEGKMVEVIRPRVEYVLIPEKAD